MRVDSQLFILMCIRERKLGVERTFVHLVIVVVVAIIVLVDNRDDK